MLAADPFCIQEGGRPLVAGVRRAHWQGPHISARQMDAVPQLDYPAIAKALEGSSQRLGLAYSPVEARRRWRGDIIWTDDGDTAGTDENRGRQETYPRRRTSSVVTPGSTRSARRRRQIPGARDVGDRKSASPLPPRHSRSVERTVVDTAEVRMQEEKIGELVPFRRIVHLGRGGQGWLVWPTRHGFAQNSRKIKPVRLHPRISAICALFFSRSFSRRELP